MTAEETGRLLLEVELHLEEEELWREDGDQDHAGWFCVSTAPFPCPAAGCDFVAEFMTAAHLILVWEERDDPNLLRHAGRAKQVGRNPHVVTYETSVRAERVVLRVGSSGAPGARRPRFVTDCFGRELPYALGIEEELFLVDGSTFEAVPDLLARRRRADR